MTETTNSGAPEPTPEIDSVVDRVPVEQAPVPGDDIPQYTYTDAGVFAAHDMMLRMGLPQAREVFAHMSPDPNDAASIVNSGKPAEFWAAMYAELHSVAGTA